jgi:hypothetical protein
LIGGEQLTMPRCCYTTYIHTHTYVQAHKRVNTYINISTYIPEKIEGIRESIDYMTIDQVSTLPPLCLCHEHTISIKHLYIYILIYIYVRRVFICINVCVDIHICTLICVYDNRRNLDTPFSLPLSWSHHLDKTPVYM